MLNIFYKRVEESEKKKRQEMIDGRNAQQKYTTHLKNCEKLFDKDQMR